MGLHELQTVPEDVRHAGEVIAGLDRCFLVGFGRLGPDQVEALQALRRVCSGTPLERRVNTAVEALGRNEFVEPHFVALAAARAAIQGAQYDALRAQAARALGRTADDGSADGPPAGGPGEVPGPVKVWQESTRHWLMELALAGFKQLEHQTLAPFAATLEQIQGEPQLTRLAALLSGFQEELLQAMPVAALPSVPVYRWADLWTRAMVGSLRPPPALAGRKVSGTLRVLGVDLRHHSSFASFDAYALLGHVGPTRVVRLTLSSYKVDAVQGAEMWSCFHVDTEPLLRAISEHLALDVRDLTLLPTGDLLWDGTAKVGKPFPFLDEAARCLAPGVAPAAALPVVEPADRHPVQLAVPVYLDGYNVQDGDEPLLSWDDGTRLPVALRRLSSASELQPEQVAASTALLGLLRFDGGAWAVQPLAVRLGGKKGGAEFTGSGAYEFVRKGKGETLAVLQERASRLLRKKS
jgi:hypothetical protein